MKIYHVTSITKFKRYMESGLIKSPVRAWKTIQEAERFSCQTGRWIILRLKLNNSFKQLEGHKDMALISNQDYRIK